MCTGDDAVVVGVEGGALLVMAVGLYRRGQQAPAPSVTRCFRRLAIFIKSMFARRRTRLPAGS